MKKALVVMAAGMGSRFGGLKQLGKFGREGKTLLDYAIDDALAAGFSKVVFVIRRDIEALFRAEVSGRYEGRAEVAYAFQELDALPEGFVLPAGRAKPWGTGHALLVCRDIVNEPFLAINADDYYGRSVYGIMGGFLDGAQKGVFALAGYRLGNTLSENGGVSRGVCETDADGFLVTVAERLGLCETDDGLVCDLDGRVFCKSTPVSMNFWAFDPSVFGILDEYFRDFLKARAAEPKSEFYLPFAIDRAVAEGRARVRVIPNDEVWKGVTYREDAESVDKFLRENR